MGKGLIGATLLLLAGAGCGGGGGGGYRAVTYDLISPGTPESVPAGYCVDVEGPASVPASTMAFTIVDTPTGIGSDSMEVGIMHEADFLAQGGCDFNLAVVDETTTGSTYDSGPVSGGAYRFIVGCSNIVDPCFFNLTWTATY